MKRGTTPTLPIQILLKNIEDIYTVEFILKQDNTEECETSVEKLYPSEDVEYNEDMNAFLVSFTEAETRLFKQDSTVWLDTRVTLNSGKIPPTEIVPLYMNRTLFAAEEPEEEPEDDTSSDS